MLAPLRVVSSMATKALLQELVAKFQSTTGTPVELISLGGVDAAKRIRGTEHFDVVVLAQNTIDALINEKLLQPPRFDVVRSGIAAASPKGQPRPTISTPAEFKIALEQASTVGYSTGPSGVYLESLFASWGLQDQIKQKTIQAPPGVPVASLITQGIVTLGFQQLSELINFDGIELLGPLPEQIQLLTTFSAGVGVATSHEPSATAFLNFLCSAEHDQAKQLHGMNAV